MEFGGAQQCVVDARANVFRTDVAFERGLLHELRGLFPGAAEKQRSAGTMNSIGEIAYGTEAGGVDRGHISQAQDDNRRQFVQAIQDL